MLINKKQDEEIREEGFGVRVRTPAITGLLCNWANGVDRCVELVGLCLEDRGLNGSNTGEKDGVCTDPGSALLRVPGAKSHQ